MNGYRTTIVEMHDKPGGLCTAWSRNGYTFDGCIHWLVGSRPGNDPMRQGWEELGAVQGKMIIDHDVFMIVEDKDGRRFTVYEDADRLEKEMLRLAPEDEITVKEFISTIKMFAEIPAGRPDKQAGDKKSGMIGNMKKFIGFIPVIIKMIKYGSMNVEQLTKRFKNSFLSFALGEIFGGIQEFSAIGLMFTLAWMHGRNAGYPIGGSLEFIRSIEERYIKLGGEVMYNSRVDKIITENGRAAGVRLKNGKEIKADMVISAADGHAAIYEMLDGKYKDENIDRIYSTYKRFPSIMQVSMGAAMDMAGEPQSVDFPLVNPITAGNAAADRMNLRIYAFDKTMAPEGCTALTVYINGDYGYWTELRRTDRAKYDEEKKRVGSEVVEAVDKKYPGFKGCVEALDVSTPATYVRYTGNWMGSFEGWLMTPKNMIKKIPRTLPGLKGFYMIGQWVSPGGGLPSGLMTGRDIVKEICRMDGKYFITAKP
jgi:phytoene dehydrogenase-like protein